MTYQLPPVEKRRVLCPWPHCNCTHDYPCVAGWIDDTDDGHEVTRPCRNCRPELHTRLATSPVFVGEVGTAFIRDLPRPSRRDYGGAA